MTYEKCCICPNNCLVDRREKTGFCGEKDTISVAFSGLHKGEEPPISGENGSGMVFFTGCTLKCPECQNYQIAHSCYKKVINVLKFCKEEMIELIKDLINMGAETISFVTGDHFLPTIAEVVKIIKNDNTIKSIPFVLNTSGYITKEAIDYIFESIDIWNFDIKTFDREVAKVITSNGEYAHSCYEALRYLCEKKTADKKPLIIARHLVYPGCAESSKKVIKIFAKEFKEKALFSLLFQFASPFNTPGADTVSKKIYQELVDLVFSLNIEDGFIQEYDGENDKKWLPDFKKENPFLPQFATPSSYFLKKLRANKSVLA